MSTDLIADLRGMVESLKTLTSLMLIIPGLDTADYAVKVAEAADALEAAQPAPLVPMTRDEIDTIWAACSDDDGSNIYNLVRMAEAHHAKGK